MPSRYYIRNFIKDNYYHIYNRGANKQSIFYKKDDYTVFTDIFSYYLTYPHGIAPSKLEEYIKSYKKIEAQRSSSATPSSLHLVCYCLMPNHFHFLIKQADEPKTDGGVTNLMRRLTITYSLYLNKEQKKTGVTFEGKYKNTFVTTESQLTHLSKYIHDNPSEIKSSLSLEDYPYSSYPEYIGRRTTKDWLHPEHILDTMFATNKKNKYKDFVEEEALNESLINRFQID